MIIIVDSQKRGIPRRHTGAYGTGLGATGRGTSEEILQRQSSGNIMALPRNKLPL
jgi:hypothetical protein